VWSIDLITVGGLAAGWRPARASGCSTIRNNVIHPEFTKCGKESANGLR
jgi:hypothetical protein